MRDLWDLPTRAVSPGASLLVWDGLVFLAVLACTICILHRRAKIWREYFQLQAGFVCLTIWQGLHLIDLVIHVCEAVVPYGYIFIQAVFVVPRTLSDVLCLLGCCRVAARYCQMGPFPLFGLVPLSFFVLFFALAHTCMNFGLVFSWLGLVSPTVVHQVAKGRNGLEAGSAALQFVTALVLACITFDDLSQRNDYLYHGQRNRDNRLTFWVAQFVLCLRTFCEVVIVGQWDRTTVDIDSARTAKDVCHGLFSVVFVGIMLSCLQPRQDDPFEEIQRRVVAEVPRELEQRLADRTNRGAQTGPALVDFFEESKARRGDHPPPSGPEDRAYNELKNDYLNGLIYLYRGWEPITRWSGATPRPKDE